jgi:hypothetical protein
MLSHINRFAIQSTYWHLRKLSVLTTRANTIKHLTTKKYLTPTDLQYIYENVDKSTSHEFKHKHLRLLYKNTCKQLLSSQPTLCDVRNFANNCLVMYVSNDDLLYKHPDFVGCMEISLDKLRNHELTVEQKWLVNVIRELYKVL